MTAHPNSLSCFIAGSKDVVRRFVPNFDAYEDVANNCTDLRSSKIIDGAGHFVQLQRPYEVNDAIRGFLRANGL